MFTLDKYKKEIVKASESGGYQEININVKGGYDPDRIEIKKPGMFNPGLSGNVGCLYPMSQHRQPGFKPANQCVGDLPKKIARVFNEQNQK